MANHKQSISVNISLFFLVWNWRLWCLPLVSLLCWYPRRLFEACRKLRKSNFLTEPATGLFFSIWAYLGGQGLPTSSKAKPGLLFSLELCVTFTLGGLSHQLIWQSYLVVKYPMEASSASNSTSWPAWWQCTSMYLHCHHRALLFTGNTLVHVGNRLSSHTKTQEFTLEETLRLCQILSLLHLQWMRTSLSPCPCRHLLHAQPMAEEMESELSCVGAGFSLEGAHIHGDGHVGGTE